MAQTKTIHHVADVPAPIQAVWEAITTQHGLSNWWTTEVEAPEIDVGETIRFAFQPSFNPQMEVTALERPHRLEWRCIGGHEPWLNSTFAWSLDQRHEDVRLRFWQHYAFELSDDAYGIYNYNWGYYLQSLYDLVTIGSGSPFGG